MRSAFLVALFCVCVCALLESGPSRIAKASGQRIVGAEPEDPGIAPDPCNGLKNAPKKCELSPSGQLCDQANATYQWYLPALSGGTNTMRYEQDQIRCNVGANDCPTVYNSNKGTMNCTPKMVP